MIPEKENIDKEKELVEGSAKQEEEKVNKSESIEKAEEIDLNTMVSVKLKWGGVVYLEVVLNVGFLMLFNSAILRKNPSKKKSISILKASLGIEKPSRSSSISTPPFNKSKPLLLRIHRKIPKVFIISDSFIPWYII